MRKYFLLFFLFLLPVLYHKFFPEIKEINEFYAKILSPISDYSYKNIVCKGDFCIVVTKDCLGVYLFLYSLSFYFIESKSKDVLDIFLLLLFSILVNILRLYLVLLSQKVFVHTVITLSLPILGYFIAKLINKV